MKWFQRWGAFVLLTSLFVAFLVHVESPEARYQHLHLAYPVIYGRTGTVGLALAGPSGMAVMVNAEEFDRQLEAKTGKRLTVVDLSRSWYGPNTDYVLLRDLAEQQEVGHLAILFRRYEGVAYPKFHQHGRIADIVEDAFAHREKRPWVRAKTALANVIEKLVDNLVLHLTGRFKTHRASELEPARTDDILAAPNPKVPEKIAAYRQKYEATWRQRTEKWALDDPKDAHARHYYRKVKELAQSEGANLSFFYVNLLWGAPLDPAFKRKAEEKYGAPILSLTREELETVYPRGYADHGHSTKFGQQTQARYFTSKIDL